MARFRILEIIVTRQVVLAGKAGGMFPTPLPQWPWQRCFPAAKGEATRRLTLERATMAAQAVVALAVKRLRLERVVVRGRL